MPENTQPTQQPGKEGGDEKPEPIRQKGEPPPESDASVGKDGADFRLLRPRRHGLLARFDFFDDYTNPKEND